MMDEIISVKNLTKKFKDFVAVDNISFSVKTGGVFAKLSALVKKAIDCCIE